MDCDLGSYSVTVCQICLSVVIVDCGYVTVTVTVMLISNEPMILVRECAGDVVVVFMVVLMIWAVMMIVVSRDQSG